VRYLRRELRTVHEYLADADVTRPAGSRVAYGRLLLKLASRTLPTSLVHPFSTKQVALRSRMLTLPFFSHEKASFSVDCAGSRAGLDGCGRPRSGPD